MPRYCVQVIDKHTYIIQADTEDEATNIADTATPHDSQCIEEIHDIEILYEV